MAVSVREATEGLAVTDDNVNYWTDDYCPFQVRHIQVWHVFHQNYNDKDEVSLDCSFNFTFIDEKHPLLSYF